MQRLTGLDDGFLWMETPTSYMHVASLIVVDGGSGTDGLTFERVRQLYESRLDYAPPFRRRLVEVPFGIHHPLWIEDPTSTSTGTCATSPCRSTATRCTT